MHRDLIDDTKVLEKEENRLNNLAKQLRCPNGKEGLEISEFLHDKNNKIIKDSIVALELEDKNRVLELGHGTCDYLPFLMDQALHLKYFGMEISELMIKEASRKNDSYIKESKALFQIYDGERVPYVHNIFDRILTINTIYFWENPLSYLNEMFRVLKPGGKFVLTFTNSIFLEELSTATNDVFLYDKYKIKELLASTDFILDNIIEKQERNKDKAGAWVDENYTIVVLSKKMRKRGIEI